MLIISQNAYDQFERDVLTLAKMDNPGIGCFSSAMLNPYRANLAKKRFGEYPVIGERSAKELEDEKKRLSPQVVSKAKEEVVHKRRKKEE